VLLEDALDAVRGHLAVGEARAVVVVNLDQRLAVAHADAAGLLELCAAAVRGQLVREHLVGFLRAGGDAAGSEANEDLHH
jgi:hypothetical protein